MPEEKEQGFKVSDRRIFNPDGTLRVLEEEPPAKLAADAPQATASTQSPVAAQSVSNLGQEAVFGAAQEEVAEEPQEDEMTEFMGAIMNIASPAFIYLGLADHPATGRPEIDLGAAQQYINILGIIREKTKGNLTRSEEEFFDGILSDMRMQFVSLRQQMPGGR